MSVRENHRHHPRRAGWGWRGCRVDLTPSSLPEVSVGRWPTAKTSDTRLRSDDCAFCPLGVLRYQKSALAAIGKRLPYPNALGEIFIPGAACWRLYSLRSTMRMTLFTISRSKW